MSKYIVNPFYKVTKCLLPIKYIHIFVHSIRKWWNMWNVDVIRSHFEKHLLYVAPDSYIQPLIFFLYLCHSFCLRIIYLFSIFIFLPLNACTDIRFGFAITLKHRNHTKHQKVGKNIEKSHTRHDFVKLCWCCWIKFQCTLPPAEMISSRFRDLLRNSIPRSVMLGQKCVTCVRVCTNNSFCACGAKYKARQKCFTAHNYLIERQLESDTHKSQIETFVKHANVRICFHEKAT